MVTDNIKFAALVEFFTGTFTFSLLTEFILQPVITLLVLLQVVSETKAEYKSVKKILDWILAILGFVIIGFTVKEAIIDYQSIDNIHIISFCIPLFFSLLYLPIAHGFAIYAKYETLFIRMEFKESHNKKQQWAHRCKVISVCKLSYKKICEFTNDYVKNMYAAMEETEFDTIISDFRIAHR